MTTSPVDIKQWIDARAVSPFQWMILLLCFLIVTFDGLDAAIMGFIAPAVIHDWDMSRTAFGPIMAAAMVGLAVGALISGPYSDRLGRRRVLLWSVGAFGFFSLLCAFARSPMELAALRFLTGLGLGAAMPNSTTLLSEYIPQRLRGILITLMFMGFGLGSASGGIVSAWMVPAYGWHAVLMLGGVLPLLLLPVLYFRLPESVDLMINRGFPRPAIMAVLRRMGARFADDVVFATTAAGETARSKVWRLFDQHYRWRTLSLWCTYFMGLVVIYLLTGWMPTLIKDAGLSLERAAIIGAQTGLNAFAPGQYPTDFRATGVSWMLGIGRFGGIFASMSGGAMLSLGLPMNVIFAGLGVPAVLAAIAIMAGPKPASGQLKVQAGH